ncbi:MAG: hypothetical protein KAS71_07105, partial [Bacteroidales bacterium]|nr:hypothetical protein [Bacteroidales bacterium]
VRAGGETLVLTLTNDTWATAMGTDDIVTTELLAGISGDQSWDLLTIDFNDVVLTDANTVTITIPAEKALSYFIGANETVSISIPAISSANTNYEIIPVPANFQIINEATTVAVSGTMTAATTENDIVAGGKNIILDLTGDIWHANIDTDEATADLLYNGISGGEWDTEVTANLTTAHISRDSDTRVTITLPSIGSYNIYADETVTISVDAGVLQSTTTDISGSSLTVTHDPLTATLTGSILGVNESAVRAGGETLVLTLTNDTWATAMGTNDIVTADLLAGITGDQSWSLLPIDFNDVVLTDANTVTITIPAEKALDYFIDANETVSISIPANSTANSSYGIIPVPADFEINNVGVTLDVTGTIKVGSANEQGVRDGGYTIVLTLDGDRWVDDIATNLSQATILFDEINGGGALEWDTQVIPALGLANITMDSEIQVTINLPGVPVYDIFVEEVISVTALSTLLKHPAAVDIAVPSAFSILPLPPTVSVSGTIDDGTLNEEDNIRSGGSNILLQLTEGIWETNVGLATNTETSALISSFSGNKDWATVTAALNYTQINRDDDYNVTITLPPVSGYQIYDNETVSTSINSDAVQYNSSPIAGTSLTIQHDSITASLGGDILTSRTESDLRQNSYYLSVTVANDVLDFTVGADNVITTAILDNITGDQNWAEVRSNLDFNNVERTNNNTLVITFPTVPNYFIEADETVSSILSSSALEHGIYDLDPGTTFNITDEPVTLTVSGSMTTDATETEQDIRDGGKTIILNLTNDEWLDDIATTNASSLFNAISSGLEWDAEVTTTISTSDITRDSETQVTIILPPVAAYNINVEEVISVDVPFSLLKHSTSGTFTGSTTFSVIPLAASVNVSGTIFDGPLDSESDISSGGPTIVLELTEGIWETNLGADNEFTDSLLTSFSGNGDWTTVNTALNFSHITRTDDYIVTIAIPSSAYDIYEDETVAITVDANAVQSTTSDIVGSSLTIQHDTLSAVIEGSIIGSNESAVRAGGETIILKLRNDVWAAAMGTDDATTADLLTGITGDQNWNLTTLDFNDVVRTNDSTVTITVASPKATNYYIGADETVTVVVPASAMAHGTYALGSQTFSITNESASASFGGTLVTTNTETEIRTVGATLTIILGGDTWHANIGTSSTETTALLDAILGDEDWTTTVRPLLNSSHVTREVDNVTVTITFPDLSAYDIYANETISAILPASTLATSLSTVTVIPNITIIHNPLVAHYPFDGNPDDISGNNNHGENFGASLTNDRFGVANSAYNFDGISSRIESNLSWSVAENDEFTITVWAKTNPDIGILRHNIIHKSESGIYADVLSLAINPEYQNSSLFMRNDDPSGHSGRPRVNFSSVNTMDGNWHLFSVKRSAGFISLKIDNYPWTDSIDYTWNDGQIMT